MSATPTPNANVSKTETICACSSIVPAFLLEKARAVCIGEAIYKHDGKIFCVMHYPDQNKTEDFRIALRQKIAAEDFNFCAVYFPEQINFADYKKSGDDPFCFTADADFNFAEFSHAAFFESSIFSGKAAFNSATFHWVADFHATTFSGKATFSSTTFHGVTSFLDAKFNDLTLFYDTRFLSVASFSNAQFKDYVKFKRNNVDDITSVLANALLGRSNADNLELFGKKASLNFDSLRIEKPERLSFHSVKLRPHWFINTDPRKFEFIDVDWGNIAKELKSELKSLQEGINQTTVTWPHRLLSIAYRQLAVNAEDNNRYTEAAQFRYNSMELRRKEKWRGLNILSLDFWYWALSGYGERVIRATVALFAILATFTFLYTKVGFVPDNPLGWRQAIIYSFGTALLQKLEPRPFTLAAQACVIAEMFLAPLQAALLALAIRRKYMR